jgi:integrase
MGRKPNVRYFDSRKAYYCQLDGVQHRLSNAPNGDDAPHGPAYLTALERFKQLLEMKNVGSAGDENKVRSLCEAHLQAYHGKRSERSFEIRTNMIQIFCDKWGELRVSEVKPWHAEQIITEHPAWGANAVRLFLTQVGAAFTWGMKQELVSRNPFRAIEKPSPTTCARERIVTPEEHTAILSLFPDRGRSRNLRRFIVALENTGARPGEIAAASVKDFNTDKGALVYYREAARRQDEHRHKNARRKDRVIHFDGDALEMVKAICAGKEPDELIFPTNKGRQYSSHCLDNCFRTIRRRLGVTAVPYSYRHTLATRWILANGSIEVLATMLGNTPETIRKHYSHIIDQHEGIRAHIERFRASGSDNRP